MQVSNPTTILIIGGYGNFGSLIAKTLDATPDVRVVVAGRRLASAVSLCAKLKQAVPYKLDIEQDLAPALNELKPHMVIHTSGPFQARNYAVAQACITFGCHYVDLADGRSFVADIDTLDSAAKANNVAVISGASSVPCLSAAVIDHYRQQFREIESVDYGITIAQKTLRGMATAKSVLSYVGKPFTTQHEFHMQKIYGWQNLRSHIYPELGRRWLGNCDIPDLDLKLFVKRYPEIDSFLFGAGNELALQQWGLWVLSWLVRWGWIKSLMPYAEKLMRLSNWLNRWGSDKSGFHMVLSGHDAQLKSVQKRFHIIARKGDGPYIPCVPAIVLGQRLARGEKIEAGARPCLDLISLPQYLMALSHLDIEVYENNQPIKAANLST